MLHFIHKSTGHVIQFSHKSIFQFQQSGFRKLYSVHFKVQLLLDVPLSTQSSHISHSSSFQFQQKCLESTLIHCSLHLPSFQFLSQWSHSSHGSKIPFQQLPLQFITSFGQLLQFSASSTFPFQQNAVHWPTSWGQVSQVSPSSINQFQHSPFHGIIQASFESSGHVLQFSHWSICPLGHFLIQVQFVEQFSQIFQFLDFHKSQSSPVSRIPFQHLGFFTTSLQFSSQLLQLAPFLSDPLSHSSPLLFSFLPFQQ